MECRCITSTYSMPNTASCETSCANCGKYWCGYGGGKSDQDESRDGLYIYMQTMPSCNMSDVHGRW